MDEGPMAGHAAQPTLKESMSKKRTPPRKANGQFRKRKKS
jgi:hypothetical protein